MRNFHKGLLIILLVLVYIFLPPLFVNEYYFSGMVGWIDLCFWGLLCALLSCFDMTDVGYKNGQYK